MNVQRLIQIPKQQLKSQDLFLEGYRELFGYAGDLSRDILENLERDYYAEIAALQDTFACVYEMGFRLDQFLQGRMLDNDFSVEFAERRTETRNQGADRALKWQAPRGAE